MNEIDLNKTIEIMDRRVKWFEERREARNFSMVFQNEFDEARLVLDFLQKCKEELNHVG